MVVILVGGCASVPESDVSNNQIAPGIAAVPSQQLILDALGEPYTEEEQVRIKQRFVSVWAKMDSGETSASKKGLEALQIDYPHFSGVYTNLALLAHKEGDLAQAEAYLKQALHLNPKSEDALVLRGLVLKDQGKLAEAEAHLAGALSLLPNSKPLHLNLGILQELYLGKQHEALLNYQRYQEMVPTDKNVEGWIIDLSRRLPQQQGNRL